MSQNVYTVSSGFSPLALRSVLGPMFFMRLSAMVSMDWISSPPSGSGTSSYAILRDVGDCEDAEMVLCCCCCCCCKNGVGLDGENAEHFDAVRQRKEIAADIFIVVVGVLLGILSFNCRGQWNLI